MKYRTCKYHTNIGALLKYLYWQAIEGGYFPPPKSTHHIHHGARY